MRRLILPLLIAAALFSGSLAGAATGRVTKALPLLLDHKGRHTLSPSLYERDAYQDHLRRNPGLRSGMKFAVHWKIKGKPAGPLLLRLELRGTAQGSLPKQLVLEKSVIPHGWFGDWTELVLKGDEYTAFGEVTAWRVSLWEKGPWEDQTLLGEQKSFLW